MNSNLYHEGQYHQNHRGGNEKKDVIKDIGNGKQGDTSEKGDWVLLLFAIDEISDTNAAKQRSPDYCRCIFHNNYFSVLSLFLHFPEVFFKYDALTLGLAMVPLDGDF